MTRAGWSLIAVLAIAIGAAPAAAAPNKSAKSPAEIADYWSDSRMKDAKPRDRARPGGGGGGGGATSDWSRYTVPTPYTDQTRVNGKLFFSLDGSRYVCSGTAVEASASVNLVWTAGHCVTDGVDAEGVEHKAQDFLFIPAYLNGTEPYGRWAGTASDSTPGWEATNDFRYDVGAIQVQKVVQSGTSWVPTSDTFAGTIGTRPIEFSTLATGTKLVSYGYPAAGKFKGNQQYACRSPLRGTDPWNPLAPAPYWISCDMTGGSSGGGWVRDANGDGDADADEPVVSVNSYGYGFEKTTMYGPQMRAGGPAQTLYASMD